MSHYDRPHHTPEIVARSCSTAITPVFDDLATMKPPGSLSDLWEKIAVREQLSVRVIFVYKSL
jgi:hypothetical protein